MDLHYIFKERVYDNRADIGEDTAMKWTTFVNLSTTTIMLDLLTNGVSEMTKSIMRLSQIYDGVDTFEGGLLS